MSLFPENDSMWLYRMYGIDKRLHMENRLEESKPPTNDNHRRNRKKNKAARAARRRNR